MTLKSGKNKILMIDDNKELLNYMRRLSDSKGWDITFMYCPIQALELNNLNEFTHIVVDLHMPGMSGEEFIKQYNGEAKIILCTSFITKHNSFLGAHDGLRKPFNLSEFKKKLNLF